MAANKTVISFTLSPPLISQLKGYAEKRECSASLLVEMAIRAYLRGRKV